MPGPAPPGSPPDPAGSGAPLLMGVVGRPHGVRGLVRVQSYTADPRDLAGYGTLTDEGGRCWSLRWRGEGVAELRDGAGRPVADRDAAMKLTNLRLYVERARLPPPDDPEEFYLADLVGARAIGLSGEEIGRVALVHDHGAGAALEIARPGLPALLVPFTKGCVPELDLVAGRITVAPPEETAIGTPADANG